MKIVKKLEKNEVERYSRQFILSQIGPKGQIKLRNAKVLIIGLGGLGSPVLMYLVSSGVVTIGIIDYDKVEIHNLQRQVIHNEESIGKSKVESACEFAKMSNSDVKIIPFDTMLSSKNAESIIKDFDVILDCSDNVAARYIINDYARILDKDFIAASVLRWEGQIFIFGRRGPCYRCLFPEPNMVTSKCDEAGVMGPACGIIGSMQALEALKIILGNSEPMIVIYNMLKNEYKKFKLQKTASCRACITKTHLPITVSCANTIKKHQSTVKQISWVEYMKHKDKYVLVDVRTPIAYEIAHFESAISIPLENIKKHLETYKFDKPVALLCKRGISACTAADVFSRNGTEAVVIEGGIENYKITFSVDFPLV